MRYIADISLWARGLTRIMQILVQKSVFTATRRWTNYIVRYKWALKRAFLDITAPDPFHPDFCAYLEQERVTYSLAHVSF